MSKIEVDCRINNIYKLVFSIEPEIDNDEYITIDKIESELYKNLIANEQFLFEADLFGLEKEDIMINYIRYFDTDVNGWILLEAEYLPIYKKDNIKLLIKISIKTMDQKKIINKYKEMKKKIRKNCQEY